RAGASPPQHVTSGEGVRKCRGLDREGFLHPELGEPGIQWTGKVHVGKALGCGQGRGGGHREGELRGPDAVPMLSVGLTAAALSGLVRAGISVLRDGGGGSVHVRPFSVRGGKCVREKTDSPITEPGYTWEAMETRRAVARTRVRATALRGSSASGGDDVLRLQALLALRDIEVHLLALEQFTVAGAGDVRVVGEDVCSAVLLLDEDEALFRIEPLHCASLQNTSPSGRYPRSHCVSSVLPQ